MYTSKPRLLIYLLLLLVLGGCTAIYSTTLVSVNTEQESSSTPDGVNAVSDCPAPTDETRLFQQEALGYCLLYPHGYEVQHLYEDTTLLLANVTSDVPQAHAIINVQDAVDRSLAQIADEVLAEVAGQLPEWEVERTEGLIVGGEAAILLNPMPGRELNRLVLVVHENRLFRLIFLPSDPEQNDAYAKMEKLYNTVMASFTFIPANRDAAALGLIWEGFTPLGDGDETYCKSLRVFRNDQALIGPCDTEGEHVQINRSLEWAEILNLFAPFQVQKGDGQLAFFGSGEREGLAWQRAIDAWARYTYAELATGRVSASVRTVLSWWLGEVPTHPGYCAHLLVLIHGYAYVSVEPCGGGEAIARAEGWLQTDEWEKFDQWLYAYMPLYQEADYFSGVGTEEMPATEIAEMAHWAEAVYARVVEATPAYLESGVAEADAASGRIVYASRHSGDMDIYIMHADGTHPIRLSQAETWDGLPTPSPDGQRIAFVAETLDSQRTPIKSDIFVVSPDGTGLTNLTDHPAFDVQPSWSPDGGQIAFVSTRDGDGYTRSLYRMAADGSGVHKLVENAEQPAWSPVDDQIAFVQDGQIYLLQLWDGVTVQLTTNASPSPQASSNANPVWSPDGSQIAFTSNRDGNGEIYVMNADGSGQTNLTNLPGYESTPIWSPDGDYIAFTSDGSGLSGIYIMQADGSAVVKVTQASTSEFLPTWSPDGEWLAFVSDPAEQVIVRAKIDDVLQGNGVIPTTLTTADHTFPVWMR